MANYDTIVTILGANKIYVLKKQQYMIFIFSHMIKKMTKSSRPNISTK